MTYNAFKINVFALARKHKLSHLVPDNDTLYRLWEQKLTPQQVIDLHCTKEASKQRHNRNK